MFRLLKSTTSLTMCVALALPTGGFAQSTSAACAAEGSEAVFPCVLPDGTEVLDAQQLSDQLQGTVSGVLDTTGAVETPAAEAEVSAQAQAEADAQAAAEAQAAADEQAAAEARAAAEKAQADADAAAAA